MSFWSARLNSLHFLFEAWRLTLSPILIQKLNLSINLLFSSTHFLVYLSCSHTNHSFSLIKTPMKFILSSRGLLSMRISIHTTTLVMILPIVSSQFVSSHLQTSQWNDFAICKFVEFKTSPFTLMLTQIQK